MKSSFILGVTFFALCLQSSLARAEDAVSSAPAASSVAAVPAPPEDPKKLVEQAEKRMDAEDLPAAIFLYDKAARLNYTPAQVQMGDLATAGEFFDTAAGWYLTAAMQGDAVGQYHLAQAYQAGLGIEKDDVKALYWYKRSAAQDYVPAIKVIGLAYVKGGFSGQIPIDPERAKAFEAKAKHLEAVLAKAAAAEQKARIEAGKEAAKRKLEAEAKKKAEAEKAEAEKAETEKK